VVQELANQQPTDIAQDPEQAANSKTAATTEQTENSVMVQQWPQSQLLNFTGNCHFPPTA